MFSDENPLLSVCWQFAHFETAKAQRTRVVQAHMNSEPSPDVACIGPIAGSMGRTGIESGLLLVVMDELLESGIRAQ